MNVKLAYILFLGAALIIGYLVGRFIAKRSVSRLSGILLYVIGAIVFIVGQVEADDDHRFRILAIGGICLQVAGIVGSFRNKRTVKVSSVDLWALRRHR